MAETSPIALDPRNLDTLQKYYQHSNVGDFPGAVQLLNETAVYRMPGKKPVIPYGGDWHGRDEVVKLYQTFMISFCIVQMSETLVLFSKNEIMAFNDEGFKTNETQRYFRVGVVHHMKFGNDNLIASMDTYFDTLPAKQAFGDVNPATQPMLAPPLPIVDDVVEGAAKNLVTTFCDAGLDPAERRKLLADDAMLTAPGAPGQVPFAGVWMGGDEVVAFYKAYDATVKNRIQTVQNMIVNGSWVGVVSSEEAEVGGAGIEFRKAELFQVSGNKISRGFLYMDTQQLTTEGEPHYELTKTLYDELWSGGKLELIEEIIHPDHVFHFPDGHSSKGRDAYKQFVSIYATAFPDMRIELEDFVGTTDKIANRITFSGTHQGVLEGIEPTGNKVSMSGQHIARVSGGMFLETWGNFDALGLMKQLGVIPDGKK
jgi:predicted ester cyclase/ketosteroid isomerase-like protein